MNILWFPPRERAQGGCGEGPAGRCDPARTVAVVIGLHSLSLLGTQRGPQGLASRAGPPVPGVGLPGGEEPVSDTPVSEPQASLPHAAFLISPVSGFLGEVFVVAEANFPS